MTSNSCYIKKMALTAIIVVLIFGSVHAQAAVKKDVSSKTLRSMARTYLAFGDYQKAHNYAAKALDKANSPRVDIGEQAICMIDLATVYSYQNNLEKAEKLFTEGVRLQKKALSDNHPYVAQTLRMLSEVHRRQGNLDRAAQILSEATGIMQTYTSDDSREMAPFILESAKLLAETENFKESESQFQKALTIFKESYGTNHLMTANVCESMAEFYLNAGELDQADQYISQALKTKSKIFGRYHAVLIDSMLTKARICRLKGRVEKSEYYISKAKGAVENSKNVITTARVYQQVKHIRNEGIVAAAVTTN